MKFSTETYTQVIKKMQDLNLEIRQRHSFMHLYTERETANLEVWLEEATKRAVDLEILSLTISRHLNHLSSALKERQQRAISKA